LAEKGFGLRVLVTGAGGLLGSKVVELAVEKGYDVYATYLTHVPPAGRAVKMDVTDREQVFKVLEAARPDAVVHCAALTNVDLCETEKELALKVNVDGARIVAEAAKSVGSYLVHVSTDYVFDGEKGMYREEDEPNPVNFYGYSKLLGEKAVEEVGGDYLTVRPSVIYGSRPAGGKTNFALWLIDSLKAGREVKILVDQYVSPTLNTNLAAMILDAVERRLTGVLHTAGATRASRFEFAVKLADVFGLDRSLIRETTMDEMKWVARRPKDTSLDVSKAMRVLGVKPMELGDALKALKEEVESCAARDSG
jgi:dTDP-4-dehydrorhamnose reductase